MLCKSGNEFFFPHGCVPDARDSIWCDLGTQQIIVDEKEKGRRERRREERDRKRRGREWYFGILILPLIP